jgi:SnoaL-like domain
MVHADVSLSEQTDHLAIRELIDAYAHCADRRDADGQKALFSIATNFTVHMEGQGSKPTQVLSGREALSPVFDDLNRYEATSTSTARARSRSIVSGAPGRATASPTISIPTTASGS